MINEKNNTFCSLIKDYNSNHPFETTYKNNLKSPSTFNSTKNKTFEIFTSKNAFSMSNLYNKEYSRNYPHDNINTDSSSYKSIKNNLKIKENKISKKKIVKNSGYDNILVINEAKKGIVKGKVEENKDYKNDRPNKEKKFNIDLIVNDKFFDLLVNVYQSEGIEVGFNNENENLIIHDNKILNNNKIDEIKELISCICLKSKCLNNYCSCHKNGNTCNKNCRCLDCENINNI